MNKHRHRHQRTLFSLLARPKRAGDERPSYLPVSSLSSLFLKHGNCPIFHRQSRSHARLETARTDLKTLSNNLVRVFSRIQDVFLRCARERRFLPEKARAWYPLSNAALSVCRPRCVFISIKYEGEFVRYARRPTTICTYGLIICICSYQPGSQGYHIQTNEQRSGRS